jgi:hypothetical protein
LARELDRPDLGNNGRRHTTALSMFAVRAPSPGHPSEKLQQHAAIGTAIVNGDAGLT